MRQRAESDDKKKPFDANYQNQAAAESSNQKNRRQAHKNLHQMLEPNEQSVI